MRAFASMVCAAVLAFAAAACVRAWTPLLQAGKFVNIYNPSGAGVSWYVNDHTLVYGAGDTWHLWGITHSEPADPLMEVNFAHATSANLTTDAFAMQPFALGSVAPETHLWAPYVFLWNGTYFMYYCGGGADRTKYYLNLATSTDLWTWQRQGTLFQSGVDGRDPTVLYLGDDFGSRFLIVYTGTNPDSTSGTVSHVNYYRTALHPAGPWGEEQILFDGGVDGNNFGGPTESPFIVRRGPNFYLFNGAWQGYALTRAWLSTNPFNFGSVPDGTAVQVGEIPSHALEVVRGVDGGAHGGWYVTHAGWEQGGVWLAPLTWLDGYDGAPTSLPVPAVGVPPLPLNFSCTLSQWIAVNGGATGSNPQWAESPSGLWGGDAMDNSFAIAMTGYPETYHAFTFSADITLVTKDGNPTSAPNNNTRNGSAAALVFNVADPYYPSGPSGCYVVNLHTASDGEAAGVKLFRFAPQYTEIASYAADIEQGETYTLSITADSQNNRVEVWVDAQNVFIAEDSTFMANIMAYAGLNVWRGSAVFNNLQFSATN